MFELQGLKNFSFVDASTSLDIKIVQVFEDDYGLFIWPSAKILAEYIWDNRKKWSGKKVIELGAGTSLPGIVCAACEAHVVLTDKKNGERVLKNIMSSVATNNPIHFTKKDGEIEPLFLKVDVLGFSWGVFDYPILSLPEFDYIIGSDLFYDNSKDYEDIISSVVYFMKCNPNAIFLTTYQNRNANKSFFILFEKWNLKYRQVELPMSYYTKHDIEPSSVFLLEIWK